MQTLSYSLAAIIAYLGLLTGVLISRFTKEELEPGKKHFRRLKTVIFLLIVVFFSYFSIKNMEILSIIFAAVALAIFLVYFTHFGAKLKTKIPIKDPHISYLALAAIFYLSARISALFVIESSLIFLFGLPMGALLACAARDKNRFKAGLKAALSHAYFVFITLALQLLPLLVP